MMDEEEILEEERGLVFANIAFEKKDGSVVSSWIGLGYFDGVNGYINRIGLLLLHHYNDKKLAQAISEVGFVGDLYPTIAETVSKEESEIEEFNYDKEAHFWTNDFSDIADFEKHLLDEAKQSGSAGELNFLWTNGSWHYHNYFIKMDDEEHEKQSDEEPIQPFLEAQEDNDRDYRYDGYDEYNVYYDEQDLSDSLEVAREDPDLGPDAVWDRPPLGRKWVNVYELFCSKYYLDHMYDGTSVDHPLSTF